MVLNEKTFDQCLRRRMCYCRTMYAMRLWETYGNEPGDGCVWSEQDIYEQVLKIIEKHKNKNF